MARTAEHERLTIYKERKGNPKHWGPYLSERAWGTVREDYSEGGNPWIYFPHDHARSRTYRWNEDGLAGISDRHQNLCFALALWNGHDPILKERLFGLDGHQGNHGEDVKEIYFYLDNTPTHSYMKMLYRYPQAAYPYEALIKENARRGHLDPEYELLDTGIFDEDRYFDVVVEYAKDEQNDVLIQITVTNQGPEAASCTTIPTLWFRNTWSWGYENGPLGEVPGKPVMRWIASQHGDAEVPEILVDDHPQIGTYHLYALDPEDVLLTENETNNERLFNTPNASRYVKDAFHRAIIHGETDAVNPDREGTKGAFVYTCTLDAGESASFRLRLSSLAYEVPFEDFDDIVQARKDEADAFYDAVQHPNLSDEERRIQRQALAGMLWTKQLYYLDIPQWLNGDPAMPPPPEARKQGRNHDWKHINNFDLISMPDKWEYPWYAAWDLAFHCISLAMVDPEFAKRQLELITREWYMHPNGQFPAYEWSFGDVNPPVHAWAALEVYQVCAQQQGERDRAFLEGIFHKLLLNFTWWVNRKDPEGRNVFQGGFLGLDNISLFDRSRTLPTGGHIDQSDATAWMAFYCVEMMRIALELAKENPIYQDIATKFFEHFLRIGTAMGQADEQDYALWDPEDRFYYDALYLPDGTVHRLKVRSLVGLLPIIASETLDGSLLKQMPDFDRRMHWFLENRPELSSNMTRVEIPYLGKTYLAALLTPDRLISVLEYMLDEDEFLSPYGIRSLSKYHEAHPVSMTANGETFTIRYEPAESQTGLFGGNSNWRGPVWLPINYLIIQGLLRLHDYYGNDLTIACPTGSGNLVTLKGVALELTRRLKKLFLLDETGRRPIYGTRTKFQEDPGWRDKILFFEYFHGDDGTGLGASHQTGWTGLIAKLIQASNADNESG